MQRLEQTDLRPLAGLKSCCVRGVVLFLRDTQDLKTFFPTDFNCLKQLIL